MSYEVCIDDKSEACHAAAFLIKGDVAFTCEPDGSGNFVFKADSVSDLYAAKSYAMERA